MSTNFRSYNLQGNGYCSKIFLDASTAIPAINSVPSDYCPTTTIPCLTIQGLNFVTPTTTGAGNVAIRGDHQQHARITNNSFSFYQNAIALTLSFAPEITYNTIANQLGTGVYIANDSTANGAHIIGNRFFNNGATTSEPALYVGGPANGGVYVCSNDMEVNYGGIQWNDVHGATDCSNYIELNTVFDQYWQNSSAFSIVGNRFGSNVNQDFSGLTNSTFDANEFAVGSIGWGANTAGITTCTSASPPCATGIEFKSTNYIFSGTIYTLPKPTASACGTSPIIGGGATRTNGSVIEGATATGCTITFEQPFDHFPQCTVTGDGVAVTMASADASSMVITHSGSPTALRWTCAQTW